MGMSRRDHSSAASRGWWEPGGEAQPKILLELLTQHWWMQ